MKLLDLNNIKDWLRNKDVLDLNGKLVLGSLKEVAHYAVPPDSGNKTVLAKVLASFFENDNEALLWIDEFGIWPSSENWTLFLGFRKSIGETRPLHEIPGHLFAKEDIETVAALLSLILYFSWGAVLIPKSTDYLIRISHDEIFSFFTKQNRELKLDLSALEEIIKATQRRKKGDS